MSKYLESYTKDPMVYEYGEGYIDGVRIISAVRTGGVNTPTESDANIRRAVACWNACAGISTEFLEGMGVGGVTEFRSNVEHLMAMKNEKLAQAESAVDRDRNKRIAIRNALDALVSVVG